MAGVADGSGEASALPLSLFVRKVDPLADHDGLLVGPRRPLVISQIPRNRNAVEERLTDHAAGCAGDKGPFGLEPDFGRTPAVQASRASRRPRKPPNESFP